MAKDITITITSETLLAFEAARFGMTETQWAAQFVNGHLSTLSSEYDRMQAEKTEEEKAAAIAFQEAYKAKMEAYEKLDEGKKAEVDALLAAAAEVPAEG